jgi:hypothetical protein
MICFREPEVCLVSGVTAVMSLFLQILLNLANVRVLFNDTFSWWVTRWRSWLGLCSTSRKVAGSIPNGVTGIFH